MRILAAVSLLALAACEVPQEVKDAYMEQVRLGQALEARCKETGDIDDCAAFQNFTTNWSQRYSQPWELAPKTL